MKLIETKTLETTAAEIVFTDIPQTYTDLYAVVSCRATAVASSVSSGVFINTAASDTTSLRVQGTGSTAARGIDASTRFYFGEYPAASSTSNTFSNAGIYFANYTGSQQKAIIADNVSENNATEAYQGIFSGICTKTAAITSLTFTGFGAITLAAGSTVSLYGIPSGSDDIVTTST
jgi:hypothetical protein